MELKVHPTESRWCSTVLVILHCVASTAAARGDSNHGEKADLKERLTPLQYDVTQNEGTEPPFKNQYWDNHEAGIYVDVVSSEPLFSSLDKFDSGTGWPSFTRPLAENNITKHIDKRLFSTRTEVRSKQANSHLGHVFNDGPAPTGLRYCINSAALRFIPVAKLDQEGLGQYKALFAEKDHGAAAGHRKTAHATFAGGCFWCMEPPFEQVQGVESVVSGYTGGTKINPSYAEVSAGRTGHAEAVDITFDPSKVSYESLLDIFWHQIDPTTPDAQFCDHGSQYRSAIFVHGDDQRKAAETSRDKWEKTGKFAGKIVTQIVAAGPFYPAEEYHQDYYKKNPIRYRYYRNGCGRDQYLDRIWGKDREKDH